MYSMKLLCVLFLCCDFSVNVFAETQPSTAPVSVQETNFNKSKNNLFQTFPPISKETINELRLNGTLRNLFASELYQNHLFVYHQWLKFWKQWVNTYREEINRLPDIANEKSSLSQDTPDLEPRLNEEDASIDPKVSIETVVSSGSVPQPGGEKIYPIYSDVDNDVLFWISEKKLHQFFNQSFQAPMTIMVNPNFQINTIISNNTHATNGKVSPDIHSNNSNDFVVFPALITSVVSNITNTTTYFVSTSQSGSNAPIRFLNSPTLTFNVVRNPNENNTELPEVTTQKTPKSITVTRETVRPGNTGTTLSVTLQPVNNETGIDSTTRNLTTLPEIITPEPQINHTACPDYDDNCTEYNHVTGAPFTAIYTTEKSPWPYMKIIYLNSTKDLIDLGADDSNLILDAEDSINSNCTGDDCDNGTIGRDLREYDAAHPKYIENLSSIPLGHVSVEQLLNSSDLNNDDWILESVVFNASGEVCYCDEMGDLEFDDFDTEDPGINETDLNRISANKDDSKGTVFVTPKSIVNFANTLSENRDNIKSFSNPLNAEEEIFKKSLAPILEALESASPDPLKSEDIPEQSQEQSTFHSYDHCQFDNIIHNASLLEQVDPKIISIAEANLNEPPHETESHRIEEQNSTSYDQIPNVNFDLLDISDTLVEDSDLFKNRSDFRKPNNDTFCENISKDIPLVINQTCIATSESPEVLYRRHSNELIEMREIMKKLRLIGLNFLDMGHLMLNGDAKCPILPKHPEELHNQKNIYPAETHE